MILRNLALTLVLVSSATVPCLGQQAALRPSPSPLFQSALPTTPPDTLALPGTYWKEGALITGVPSAIFGGALAYGFCGWDGGNDSNCGLKAVAGAAIFGLIGAIPGALIGGQFRKPE